MPVSLPHPFDSSTPHLSRPRVVAVAFSAPDPDALAERLVGMDRCRPEAAGSGERYRLRHPAGWSVIVRDDSAVAVLPEVLP